MTRNDIIDLKRRLRKLKHFERVIRSQNGIYDDKPFVWDKFFDARDNPCNKALYPLSKLIGISRDEYKSITDEFFARVYYEIYAYNGITDGVIYDTEVLAKLDLPPIADEAAVKKRFRELAKLYHPDTGGDAMEFIELMQTYKKLIKG